MKGQRRKMGFTWAPSSPSVTYSEKRGHILENTHTKGKFIHHCIHTFKITYQTHNHEGPASISICRHH